MGYYIFSFGIKTKEIQAVFGSKNAELQAKVEAHDTFANYNENNFRYSVKEALTDIIHANPYNQRAGYAYGYALIALCAALGREVPAYQEIKMGFETDLIEKVLKEDYDIEYFEIQHELLPFKVGEEEPFSLPTIDDWPLIGLINRAEITELRDQLAALNITDEKISEIEKMNERYHTIRNGEVDEEMEELHRKMIYGELNEEEDERYSNIREQLENWNDEKVYAYMHLRDLLLNLNFCLEHDLEMISFCH